MLANIFRRLGLCGVASKPGVRMKSEVAPVLQSFENLPRTLLLSPFPVVSMFLPQKIQSSVELSKRETTSYGAVANSNKRNKP